MAEWSRAGDGLPEKLARFVASEWEGDQPLKDWRTACIEWLDAHPGTRMPFGQHGDKLDCFRAAREYHLTG